MSQKFRGIDLNNTAIELVVEDDMITAVRRLLRTLRCLGFAVAGRLQHNGALSAYNNLAENAPASCVRWLSI